MPADGFAKRAIEHAPGVYLDLPMDEYVRDPALSGSAFKKLLSDPAALWWESDQNPLFLRPERRSDRARLRGSAAHCMVLEGAEAYAARYTVKPEGVMTTAADLKRWLGAKRLAMIEASADSKLCKEDRDAVKQTGEFEELCQRVLALDPKAPIWTLEEDVETLHPADDQYVRLIDRFVRSDPTFYPLITGGLPEISIFWTEDDLRFKARIDYLTPHTILDLKTYGRAPRRGNDLKRHCLFEATFNGYDIQARHNANAVAALEAHALDLFGTRSVKQFDAVNGFLARVMVGRPVFRWLFMRMGGAPTGISIPFRASCGQWAEAQRQIDEACAIYRAFRAKFPNGEPWLVTHGEQEVEDIDWPYAAIGAGAEIEGDEA